MSAETGLFKRHFVGRDGFYWWIGQIATDTWTQNAPGSTPTGSTSEENKGFSYRYQVRIMGYHTADVSEETGLKDEDLPWAQVMYPVTAGGSNATMETPVLREGQFVYGFFLDGEDFQQPIIMGILGYNQYTSLEETNADLAPFTPFLGYGARQAKPTHQLMVDGDSGPKTPPQPPATQPNQQSAAQSAAGQPEDSSSNEGLRGSMNTYTGDAADPGLTAAAKKEAADVRDVPVAQPKTCDNNKSPNKIQKEIQNMIQNVQNARKGLTDLRYTITNPTQYQESQVSAQRYIDIQIQKTARSVSGWMKDRVEDMMQFVIRKVNVALMGVYQNLFPDKRSDLKSLVEAAMDQIACMFKNIMGNLMGIIRNLLNELMNRYINVPACAAENIVASILGQLTGQIGGSVDLSLGPLAGMTGPLDMASQLMGFVEQVLSFLSCDDDPDCPTTTSWNMSGGGGVPPSPFNPASLIERVSQFAAGAQGFDPTSGFNFDMDWSSLTQPSACDTGPRACGPPKIVFWGGQGHSAQGNAVVSAAGELLGVDMVSLGMNYGNGQPFISIVDDCNRGQGAVAIAVTGPVSPAATGYFQSNTPNNLNETPSTSNDWTQLGTTNTYQNCSTEISRGDNPPDNSGVWCLRTENIPTGVQPWDPLRNYNPDDYVTFTVLANPPSNVPEWNPRTTYADEAQVKVTSYVPDPSGTEVGVTGVRMDDTGYGYLPTPDGSQGGDGRTWADADQTTVRRGPGGPGGDNADGTYDIPYNPGALIPVYNGDTINLPPGTEVDLVNPDGRTVSIYGGTTVVVMDGVLTAPILDLNTVSPGQYPLQDESYPVILTLCNLTIAEGGWRYEETDKVVVEPANGAEITPQYGPWGNLIDLKIVSGGEGFQEMPKVYIESKTGFNARIIPKLCIDRVGVDKLKQPEIQDKLVSVVDCVGKF